MKITRKIVSLLLVICMAVTFMPVLAGAEDTPEYTYVGNGLAKKYDGQPITFNAATDIAVDGVVGVFDSSKLTVGFYRVEAAMEPESNPTEQGDYRLIIQDVDGMPLLNIFFQIFDENHSHSFGDWTDGGDKCKRVCDECGFIEFQEHVYEADGWMESIDPLMHERSCTVCGHVQKAPHDESEWLVDENDGVHYKYCATCGNSYDYGDHEIDKEEWKTDAEKHWNECSVCGDKENEAAHTFGAWQYSDNDKERHFRVCSVCGYVETAEHTFDEWHNPVTHDDPTIQLRNCTVCGYGEQRPTPTETPEPTATPTPEPTATPTPEPTPTAAPIPTAAPAVNSDTVSLRFYSRGGTIQTTINVPVDPDGKRGAYNAPSPLEFTGFTALGWRSDDKAQEPESLLSDTATDFYAVYSADVTLSYETNGGANVADDTKKIYYNAAGTRSVPEFTFAAAPEKVNDTFVAWAMGSRDGIRYGAGDKITLGADTKVYAVWQSDTITEYTVTYDYKTNGGTNISATTDTMKIASGGRADLTYKSDKDGYEFVGWNTDKNAHEALDAYTVGGDVTLYAIFKKEIKAVFITNPSAGSSVKQHTETAVLYNNQSSAVVTAPELVKVEGFDADGWRTDTDAAAAMYKTGAVEIAGDVTFYPVYKRFLRLTYDTNGSNIAIAASSALQYMTGANKQSVTFTLAAAPSRSGYVFNSWDVSADPTRGYAGGDTVTLSDNAVAKASWTEEEIKGVNVAYDFASNGGSSVTGVQSVTVKKGEKADLTPAAVRYGYEFVGWNTDKNAHEALSECAVRQDTVLYAIFKKDISAVFYSGTEFTPNKQYPTENTALWNNDRLAAVNAPEAAGIDGWKFEGWRTDRHALEPQYKNGDEIKISGYTEFYAVYSREITVTTNSDVDKYNQYSNTAGGIERIPVVLEQPEDTYSENNTSRFAYWEVTYTDEETGEKTTEIITSETAVNVSASTEITAKWVNIPEGASLPSVETVGASVSSQTSATLFEKVVHDSIEGNEILLQGFVYWSKLDSASKYTVLVDDAADMEYELTNLSPGTDYYYYAFAANAAGIGKGTIKSFATESDDRPNALIISPEYVTVEKGGEYQLLATLLPVSAANRALVWESSDESVVKVDENGKLTAIGAGSAVVTATTEVDRLSAECIVDVTEKTEIKEYNFSEWNMASNTSIYAPNNTGFDWDTANFGGNHQIGTAYLARWDGAVLEENDPYPAFNSNPASLYKKAESDYHVQNVEWLPKREGALDNDEIKSALMEFGAVYTLMSIDWACFDATMTNYYCPYQTTINGHAITIVGWDDNYSKSKFTQTPPSDGAFICKNSWGTEIGEEGFFYISYYDANMGRLDTNAVVTGIEKNTNYNKIYQYDPFGAIGYIGYDETTYAANIFPEKGKTLAADETLRAVSFYTFQKNTSYDVYVVTDYKDDTSLEMLRIPVAAGTIRNAGYHTVNLGADITLKAGTRFAVVVRLNTPGENSYVYCEYPVGGYSSNARANADESYYSPDGESWWDLTGDVANANFCIKAFTDNGAALTSAQLFSGIDNAGREYASDEVYTLSEAADKGLPVSEEYIEYTENADKGISLMADGLQMTGSVPAIARSGANSVTFTDGAIFPSSYDLRTMGLVSSVKNQGEWGTCWAHTMYASLESNILRRMKTTETGAEDVTSPADQLTLSRSALTMDVGASMTLAKKITPVAVKDKSVIWLSSDESTATVDTNGTIRAVGEGTATISAASVSGGVTRSCSVVVGDDSETTITLEDDRINKEIGDVFMVAYSVTPMKADTAAVGWISDNPLVASVNENGVITANADGTANISITSAEGKIEDTVKVVVGNGFNCAIDNIDDSALVYEESVLKGSVKLTLSSIAPADTAGTVILAVYDSDGFMKGTVSRVVSLAAGANDISVDDIELQGIEAGGYTIKCFAWDSFLAVSPLALSAEKQIILE